MRLLCILLCFFSVMSCSDSAGGSSTGGGSEIIVMVQDSTIQGTVKGLKSGYRVSVYEKSYIPGNLSKKDFINETVEKSAAEKEFTIATLKTGLYSLYIEDTAEGSSVFIHDLKLSEMSDTTFRREFTEPISIKGTSDLESWDDKTYYLLCLGTPFMAEVDENGAFSFTEIPVGEYTLVAIEDNKFDGPEPELIHLITNGIKSETVTFDSTTMTITVQAQRSLK